MHSLLFTGFNRCTMISLMSMCYAWINDINILIWSHSVHALDKMHTNIPKSDRKSVSKIFLISVWPTGQYDLNRLICNRATNTPKWFIQVNLHVFDFSLFAIYPNMLHFLYAYTLFTYLAQHWNLLVDFQRNKTNSNTSCTVLKPKKDSTFFEFLVQYIHLNHKL